MPATFDQFSALYARLREVWGNTNSTFEELEKAYIDAMAAGITCDSDLAGTITLGIQDEYDRRMSYFLTRWKKPRPEIVRASITRYFGGNHYYVRFRNRAAGVEICEKMNTPEQAQKFLTRKSRQLRKLGLAIEIEDFTGGGI